MSNSRIEQIIEEIEDYIDTCKGPLLGSGDKIIVNRERMEELLRELRLKTPEEIRRYQKILANKDAIMADAQKKASAIVEQANLQNMIRQVVEASNAHYAGMMGNFESFYAQLTSNREELGIQPQSVQEQLPEEQ